ncbi:MAG: accessory Sec system translocase SecA2 [Bacillota bacterium]|nr:accessory Sec system translocase SecA2 [Bacillota bacterium]
MKINKIDFKKLARQLKYKHVEFDTESYVSLLEEINSYNFESNDDSSLKEMSQKLKWKVSQGEALDRLLPETYAVVREMSARVLGMRHFDVQVLAGIAMHYGNIVEMQTGEGKTLAAVLPACLNALTGKGVHILTFNDYLAKRDAEWMGPVYRMFGLSVGYVQEKMSPEQRRKAYECDITYLTARESGFDYIRDFLCTDERQLILKPYNFAIVDEADSIMIDEARVPLVIAGKMDEDQNTPQLMADIVKGMTFGQDYDTDEYSRNVYLTDAGTHKAEKLLNCGNLYLPANIWLLTALNSALHAQALLKREKDYIVRNGKIEIIDEFTGRIAEKRHWPDGLQSAVEAKEGLKSDSRGRILNSITMQDFLKLYPKLCGMTGTAKSASDEFFEFYGLNVAVIPTNKPCIRIDHPDMIFTHTEAKINALVKEIKQVHDTGRPILIGTLTVEESERLEKALKSAGVECQVLNAKNDELEAKIITNAGKLGAVTVSTNMAGRGADIKLGGENEEEHDRVAELGGLYVIGTNRHESMRIDNQLKGRAGRQGDPGSTRFFISLEDDLMIRYRLKDLIPPKYYPSKQDDPIDGDILGREISSAQKIIDGQNFDIRRNLKKYTIILEQQRQIIHKRRYEVLTGRQPMQILENRSPVRYAELKRSIGEDILKKVEKLLALYYMNRCWEDYLDYVGYIREGIHLVAIAGKDPQLEFHQKVIAAFNEMQESIISSMVDKFNSAKIDENGINLEKEGLKGPSSTWTYIIDDGTEQFGMLKMLGDTAAMAAGAFLIPLSMLYGVFNKNSNRRKIYKI